MSFIMLSGFIIFFYSIFLLKIVLLIPNKINFFNLKNKQNKTLKGSKFMKFRRNISDGSNMRF